MVADKKSAGKYKITKVTKKNGKVTGGTVTYMGPYNKNCKKANIKNTVKLAGATFKITQINTAAFKGCKKIKTVTIGANVTSIGKEAFKGCKKLTTIKIKSLKLKKIGKKAFGSINSKAVFNVSKKIKSKVLKNYKKLIKKAGVKKVSIKKVKL